MTINNLIKKHKNIYIYRHIYKDYFNKYKYKKLVYSLRLYGANKTVIGITLHKTNFPHLYRHDFSTIKELYKAIKDSNETTMETYENHVKIKKEQLVKLASSIDTYQKFLLKYPEWLI